MTSRFPLPARRGNQIRTLQWIEALDDMSGVIVAPEPESGDAIDDLKDLGVDVVTYRAGRAEQIFGLVRAALSGRPVQEGLYDVGVAREALTSVLGRVGFNLAIVQMIRCGWAADLISNHPSPPAIVFDAIDAMSLHFRRGAKSRGWPLSLVMRREAIRCEQREAEMSQLAQLAVAVASRDIDAMQLGDCEARVVPVAGREIDLDLPGDGPPTVLLSGNLGYRPTVEGAVWFARKVWPELKARVPTLRWVLVGARPALSVRRLGRLEGVEVHSDVPDLLPYFTQATLAIAPMFNGSGVPMKVLEAWAAGVPVIASSWAAEGVEPQSRSALCIAEKEDDWIAAMLELLHDSELAEGYRKAGVQAWTEIYSPAQIRKRTRDVAATAMRPPTTVV